MQQQQGLPLPPQPASSVAEGEKLPLLVLTSTPACADSGMGQPWQRPAKFRPAGAPAGAWPHTAWYICECLSHRPATQRAGRPLPPFPLGAHTRDPCTHALPCPSSTLQARSTTLTSASTSGRTGFLGSDSSFSGEACSACSAHFASSAPPPHPKGKPYTLLPGRAQPQDAGQGGGGAWRLGAVRLLLLRGDDPPVVSHYSCVARRPRAGESPGGERGQAQHPPRPALSRARWGGGGVGGRRTAQRSWGRRPAPAGRQAGMCACLAAQGWGGGSKCPRCHTPHDAAVPRVCHAPTHITLFCSDCMLVFLLQEKIDHLCIPFLIVGTPLTAVMVGERGVGVDGRGGGVCVAGGGGWGGGRGEGGASGCPWPPHPQQLDGREGTTLMQPARGGVA